MYDILKLKKLTTQTLIGILISGSLITPLGTKTAIAGRCSNNGHGNNAPIIITLSSGKTFILKKFDPSNRGNGGYLRRELSKLNLYKSEVSEAVQLILQGDYDYETKPGKNKNCEPDEIIDDEGGLPF